MNNEQLFLLKNSIFLEYWIKCKTFCAMKYAWFQQQNIRLNDNNNSYSQDHTESKKTETDVTLTIGKHDFLPISQILFYFAHSRQEKSAKNFKVPKVGFGTAIPKPMVKSIVN